MNTAKPKPGLSSLRVRLVGTVFLAIAPALVILYFTHSPAMGFVIGLLALGAAWFGGERFVLRQLRKLVQAVERLGGGDLDTRTGLATEPGEIGQLARTFDDMAATIQQRVHEREEAEQLALNRALQQTAVAALGQFALTSDDFSALLSQAVMLVSQTLEVELCRVLELLPENKGLLFRAGVGWKKGIVGIAVINADSDSQAGHTLKSGEPVVITDLHVDNRFQCDPLLEDHSVVSGVSVAIAARGLTFGVLSVYSTRPRGFNSDDLQFLLAVANALAVAVEHRRAEAELKKVADFTRLNPNPALELGPDAKITYFNQAALRLVESVGCEHPREILPLDIGKVVQACLATGQNKLNMEAQFEGHVFSWSFHPLPANRIVHCYVTDITERLSLEAQLRQSQKMESVGQLAAGVAHDFNNMLTVIHGHAGMLMSRAALSPDMRESVQAVSFAAERAASLTRQLLLFSRKSVMQPRLIDLRDVVGSMSKMLKRLLGETITLEFIPPPHIPFVNGDTAMIEQVLMNLAVNARDAMALGGKLTIDIEPATIKAGYLETHPEARSGSFVRLRVTDTGHGMNASTMARIFEPFFTTKDPGKGTGLGLATVYGIVKQHDGWIEVASQSGRGTTFSILLPASNETASATRKAELLVAPVLGGKETILIVEDEPTVLEMGKIILQDCGYQVLEAASGVAALEVWREHQDTIDLLLTDMVMPKGISGMELAHHLLMQKASLKVVYTSGYSVDQFETDFIKKGTGAFLQKPYTRFTLANAVRARLDQ